MFKAIRILLVVVMLLTVSSVRAAHKYPDYPARPADDYSVKVTRANVTIGAETIEGLREQKTYFNADMTSQGFMPVFLVIQNNSIMDSFLFEKSNIGYARASSDSAETEVAKITFAKIVFANWGTLVKSMEIRENILKREIQSKTLSPGTSVCGFLYIPVPKWKGPRQKIHLQVPLTRSGTNETYVFNLFF